MRESLSSVLSVTFLACLDAIIRVFQDCLEQVDIDMHVFWWYIHEDIVAH
jgi:hypothetical protein